MYRYLSPEFARALVDRGGFRIGILSEYRHHEELSDFRGDEGEGTLRVTMDVPPGVYRGGPPPQMAGLFTGGNPTVVIAQGVRVIRRLVTEDVWVYCLSKEFSEKTLALPDYGACVEIEDVGGFRGELCRAMVAAGHEFREAMMGPCIYEDRDVDANVSRGGHALLLKPPKFAHQEEYRLWWVPAQRLVEPIVMEWPELRKFCKLKAIIDPPAKSVLPVSPPA